MLEGSYMVSHGGVIARRERDAMMLFARSRQFWDKAEQAGTVRRVGPFFLAPGSGAHDDIAFFVLYLGKLKDLHALVTSEEYERIYAVAAQVFRGFKTRLYGGGTDAELERVMKAATEEWSAAGFMGGGQQGH